MENQKKSQNDNVGSFTVKSGLAQMLKGGVIMDVISVEHAVIAEEAGAVAVMALERVPAEERAQWLGKIGAHTHNAVAVRL